MKSNINLEGAEQRLPSQKRCRARVKAVTTDFQPPPPKTERRLQLEGIPLTTNRLRLRPIEENDLKLLHRWRNEARFMNLCSIRRDPIDFDKFVVQAKRDFERKLPLEFIIELKNDGVPIGTIYASNINLIDGYTFLSIYLDERYEKKGYGGEATIIFLNYLFKSSPLHKIYLEAFEYNLPCVSMLGDEDLSQEGVFKEHKLFNSKRWDLLRFAIYRTALERLEKFVNRLAAKDEQLGN